ncbi:MAG: hypothetical protein HFJ38_02735 [Bacilli bacterium]|nr:hypothetical protein [Bacilli bacterium]
MDPKFSKNTELLEKLKEKKSTNIEYSNDSDDGNIKKKKMIKNLFRLIVLAVIIALIFFILSLFFMGKKSYNEVEILMKKAASKYYSEHSKKLPKTTGGTVEISAKNLSNLGYMKDIGKYIKKGTCSGKVVVENNDDTFVYTPYLDCGESYKTMELFREITKSAHLVTEGPGLYAQDNQYVFRGEVTTNYISLNNRLYRIVKVDANNEIELISQEEKEQTSVSWDNRYNSDIKSSYGINDFNISRLKNSLDRIYEQDGKRAFFTDKEREYIVYHNYCIDKTGPKDPISSDCLQSSVKMKVGLLTASEYMNASLDDECTYVTSRSCQNYNYLVKSNVDWWLITASGLSSYEAFSVSGGTIGVSKCFMMKKLRPVIYLNSKTMYKSGTGTKDDPYLVK